MSRRRRKKKQMGFAPRVVICKCTKRIGIPHPLMLKNNSGGKGKVIAHGHCEDCRIEYHLTWSGRIYSHPYKPTENRG